MDILDNPNIKQLIEQAESAVRMLGQVDSHGKRQVKHALNGVYENIGRHVHALSRQLASGSGEAGLGSGKPISIDELEELTTEIENTDEVGQGASDASSTDDLTTPDWLESQQESAPISVEHVEAHLQQALAQVRVKLAADDADVNWVYQLENLLDMLDMSEDLDDEVELAVEATKLQWATTNMYDSWSSYPRLIQVALTGMLACRAHVVRERLPSSLAPNSVIDRLRTQQYRSGSRPVLSLKPAAEPEDESWANDATLWWNILAAFVTATA